MNDFTPPPGPPLQNQPNSNVEQQSNNTQPASQPSTSSNNGEKLWERPWTIEEMRKGSSNWNLAADAGVRIIALN